MRGDWVYGEGTGCVCGGGGLGAWGLGVWGTRCMGLGVWGGGD